MRPTVLAAALAIVLGSAAAQAIAWPALAAAQPVSGAAPVSKTGSYSPYERQSIREVEQHLGVEVDPAADGKIIEGIDVVTLEVFEPRDPLPGFLNKLHVTTRPYVVGREMLLREGEAYVRVLADETARNLRTLPQLSLVVVVPLRGSAPDKVRVAVITKDVWSLRLSWDLAYGSGGLQKLLVQPSETNLFGTQQSVSLRFNYLPKSVSLGASYTIPRLFGSRVAATAAVNAIVNNNTGKTEGSFGSVSVGQPLYSSLAEWAWNVSGSWANQVSRRYVDTEVGGFVAKATPDEPLGTKHGAIYYQFRSVSASAGASVTRSFGWRIKNDVSVGFGASTSSARTFDDYSNADPVTVAAFKNTRLPRNDDRVGPFVQYHAYTTDFMRVLDFETLGLQEDFRLGHEAYLKVYPVNEALGSTRSFVGVFAAAQYTVPIGDGLARLAVEWLTETMSDHLSDASLSAGARVVSPHTSVGRLVFDATVVSRYRNYLNGTSFLGGDTRLRGFPSAFFAGKDLVAYNVEFRSRPVEILSCQVGGAVFYDSGSAFDGWQNRQMYHSAGVGFRVLFPQLDRIVFRGDIAMPFERYAAATDSAHPSTPLGIRPVAFFFGFDQAFGVPRVAP